MSGRHARTVTVLGLLGSLACQRAPALTPAPSPSPKAAVVQSAPPKLNKSPAPGPAPEGMLWISGEFTMGCADEAMGADAQPLHRVAVDDFWMDATEVTNEQFGRFVKATGHVTVAERTPRAEDFPGAPPGNLVDRARPRSAAPRSPRLPRGGSGRCSRDL